MRPKTFSLATSGDRYLATSGDRYLATDTPKRSNPEPDRRHERRLKARHPRPPNRAEGGSARRPGRRVPRTGLGGWCLTACLGSAGDPGWRRC